MYQHRNTLKYLINLCIAECHNRIEPVDDVCDWHWFTITKICFYFKSGLSPISINVFRVVADSRFDCDSRNMFTKSHIWQTPHLLHIINNNCGWSIQIRNRIKNIIDWYQFLAIKFVLWRMYALKMCYRRTGISVYVEYCFFLFVGA